MPFEKKIYKAVLFQRVIRGFLNGAEKAMKRRGVSGGPEGIRLSHTPGRKKDVEDK
jgi:hypothetical protein